MDPNDSVYKVANDFRRDMSARSALLFELEAHPATTPEQMELVLANGVALHAQARPIWELFAIRCAEKGIGLCRYADLPNRTVPLITEPPAGSRLRPSTRVQIKHLKP